MNRSKMSQETFRTRFGLIVSLLGMAVGTGNIWRFPRVLAQNGGGAFLIPWFLFLFLWSIPLLMIEFALGQKLRKGVLSCFAKLSDGKWTWLGGFIVICTLAIMFYYSVVTGWCLYYLISSFSGSLLHGDSKLFWDTFSQAPLATLFFHGVSTGLAILVVTRGIQKGIELVNSIMIPTLFLFLMFLAWIAIRQPGGIKGLEFIFSTNFERLLEYKVWLEALTQSAWSTGAGWGLALIYACYSRAHDDPVLTPFTTGLGNNAGEIIAGMAIIPTLFSFFPLEEVLQLMESGNTGLTFISLPGLFQKMAAGRILAILFFTSLFFAAFASLLSMFELGVYFLSELGLKRNQAILGIGVVCFLLGAPSAIHLPFMDNQDWVWGIGLLLSGLFFTVLMRCIGMERFVRDFVPLRSKFHRAIFEFLVFWLIPFEFIALLIWWFYQAIQSDPGGWWNPFHTASVGTCLFQWGALLLILFLLNRKMSDKVGAGLKPAPTPKT